MVDGGFKISERPAEADDRTAEVSSWLAGLVVSPGQDPPAAASVAGAALMPLTGPAAPWAGVATDVPALRSFSALGRAGWL